MIAEYQISMNNSNGVKMDSNTQDNTNIESPQNVAKTLAVNQIEESVDFSYPNGLWILGYKY